MYYAQYEWTKVNSCPPGTHIIRALDTITYEECGVVWQKWFFADDSELKLCRENNQLIWSITKSQKAVISPEKTKALFA